MKWSRPAFPRLTSFLHHASSCLRFGNPPPELFRESPGPKLCHWIQRSYMDELADLHGFGCGSTLMQFMYAPEGSIDSLLSILSFNILHFYSVKLLWHHIPCKKKHNSHSKGCIGIGITSKPLHDFIGCLSSGPHQQKPSAIAMASSSGFQPLLPQPAWQWALVWGRGMPPARRDRRTAVWGIAFLSLGF